MEILEYSVHYVATSILWLRVVKLTVCLPYGEIPMPNPHFFFDTSVDSIYIMSEMHLQ
jgi:hypothetical protein